MKIENIKVEILKPYKLNSKKHPESQIEGIKNSINRFGFTQPVIIDKENEIIIGHGRVEAAKAAGLKEVPCVRRDDLSPQEVKALRLIDNRISETGWDGELLGIDLSEIDFDFTPFNISFDDLIEVPEVEGLTDQDAMPDNVEPRTKPGDLYTLGAHRLLCGDSTNKTSVDKLMDGKKADMVFTDPPYSVNYAKKNRDVLGAKEYTEIKNDNLSVDETARIIWKPVFDNLAEASKDGASFYATMPQGGDQMMMMMMMMMDSWQVKHELIWVKNSPVFSMGRLDYDYMHEPIVYGWKKSHKFYGGGEHKKSVWFIKRDGNKSHPTMKPVELITNAISNSSKDNDIVIDFFLGSGSTLIACEKTNRVCYGAELDPHYCDVIVKRWEDFTGKKAELINA